MAKEKQHVFSARTTEAGLERLNELRKELKVGWDELVVEAVSAHYNLDRSVMALPKREAPAKATEATAEERPAEEKPPEEPPAKKRKAKGGKVNK